MSWANPSARVLCEHRHHERNGHPDEPPRCGAFAAIPETVFMGMHDRSKPFPGDNDVGFSVDANGHKDFLVLNSVRRRTGMPVHRPPLRLVI